MMTDANDFQTYLDTTPRQALVQSERERAAIYAHIGEFVSMWARAVSNLMIAAAHWANPRGRNMQKFFLGENTARKIDALNLFFPDEWLDGQNLIRHLREANQYRNTIAHWSLAMSGWDGKNQLGWHFSVLLKGKQLLIDVNDLEPQTLKVNALCNALICVCGQPYFDEQGNQTSAGFSQRNLAGQISGLPGTWASRDQRSRFLALLTEMFP